MAVATFRTGVAHLAEALAADIVPFGLAGTELVMPPDPSVVEGRLIAGMPVAVHRNRWRSRSVHRFTSCRTKHRSRSPSACRQLASRARCSGQAAKSRGSV